MKIIILGAGQVGSSVAANLVREDDDITLIDTDPTALERINERLDLRTVIGSASHPQVLESAGARDADMILAFTNSDETNMIACQVAYTLFHTPTKIARIRSLEYLHYQELFAQDALPIDVLITPEKLVTNYIQQLFIYPGALQVVDFAEGKVQMVVLKASQNSIMAGHSLRELKAKLCDIQYQIPLIFRDINPIIADEETRIEANDEVFFIGSKDNIKKLFQITKQKEKPFKNIMIAGGGNIGLSLAKSLEHHYRVKVIEHNHQHAYAASVILKRGIVIHGDATDESLLHEEGIYQTDVFCALTNSDEANLISSMLAKRFEARKVITLVNSPTYVDLIQSNVIDIAISPQQTTIGSLLAHVRQGDVVVVHTLHRGAAEAIEAIAHGDEYSSKVIGKMIKDIRLPPSVTISIIVRGDQILITDQNTVIEQDDHVILIVADRKYVPDVESLFHVDIKFSKV